jgi:peroxiredoxin
VNSEASIEDLTVAAEKKWLEGWTSGPTEPEGYGLPKGAPAPDLLLADHNGDDRHLSEFWSDRPALLMFWRHFGCSCGVDRAKRLLDEYPAYQEAGLVPLIITQGEPARAAAYRDQYRLPCPLLSDPDHVAYRAFGVSQWSVERVLFDAPPEYWAHTAELGADFQSGRRKEGRFLVDDPWRAAAEFVVGSDGRVRLCYMYQHCEDFPDPRVLTTAARLA